MDQNINLIQNNCQDIDYNNYEQYADKIIKLLKKESVNINKLIKNTNTLKNKNEKLIKKPENVDDIKNNISEIVDKTNELRNSLHIYNNIVSLLNE